ncbi:hypothetical protein EZV62_003187 [Acer yangbiense]|uniref:Jacalin-type lectin domain-containing protein n=1 Tax=Acer yangbiense TaxID=1000413 RepID=A0A5C7IHQ2_9ROSI|nr:hypothetical protein EZV62_003187 [Acer yangbiense]
MRSTHNQVRSLIKGELYGGQGGSDWDYCPESGIVEITIIYSDVIDSLHFKHAIEHSTDKSSEKFGGCGGKNQQTIKIEWPNEYLIKISGTIATFDKDEVIGTLSFTTNRNNKYGPFGSKSDCYCKSSFELISEKNQAVVGFFGRQGNFIESIGVYCKDPPAPIVITKLISAITLEKDIPRELGPWGGNKGKAWDDGRLQGRIIEIDVHVGNGVVHALHYRYKSTKDCDLSNKHGGEGATTIYRIELDKDKCSPENLVGISGFYGASDGNCCVECEYQVTSNLFSRIRVTEKPKPVQELSEEEKQVRKRTITALYLVGLFKDTNLCAIHTKHVTIMHSCPRISSWLGGSGRSTHNQDRSPIKGELWGSHGGCDWDYCPESGIVEITIIYSDVIDSLHFKNAGAIENSTDKSSEKFGGCGGKNQQTIIIDWPNEYLTKISGTIGTFHKDEVIGTLSFTTNRNKKYGPFGCKKDCEICKSPFELISEKNRAVVGFFGRQSNFINAIGVYYKDPPAPIVTTKLISAITLDKDIPRELGPWGGNKGKAWDDGRLQGRIIEIDVHVGNGVVHALHYRYKSTKYCNLSNKHGGEGATTIYRIELDKDKCSPENLVGISGFYGAFDGNCCVECEYKVVRSISFYTNKGKYGPFGTEIGTFFNSPACTNAKVVGFHGRSGEYLDAIGVHVEYLSSSTHA